MPKKPFKRNKQKTIKTAEVQTAEVETCPACTSAVDAKAAVCAQCGADLTYYRKQSSASE